MIRLAICEDDPRFRRTLAKVLRAIPDFEVVQELGRGEVVRAFCQHTAVDLLLLDLELPGINGLDVIRSLLPLSAAPEILVLTSFADETRVFQAVQQGAAGYLVKGLDPQRLERAIREVIAGGTVIDAKLARRFWNYFASVQGHSGQDYGLSPEELEVLSLVARGLSNPEAAQALGASRREIKGHLENIYRKLGVGSRVEATVRALQAGLIRL